MPSGTAIKLCTRCTLEEGCYRLHGTGGCEKPLFFTLSATDTSATDTSNWSQDTHPNINQPLIKMKLHFGPKARKLFFTRPSGSQRQGFCGWPERVKTSTKIEFPSSGWCLLGVFHRPLTLILLQKYRDTNEMRIVIQIGGVSTTFAIGRAYFGKSIAIEMGAVLRYFSEVLPC